MEQEQMTPEQIKLVLTNLFIGIENRSNQVKDAADNLLTIGERLNSLPKPPGIEVDSLIQSYSDGVADVMQGNRHIREAKEEMATLLNQQ